MTITRWSERDELWNACITREVGRTATSKVGTHDGSIGMELKLANWAVDMDQTILDHMDGACVACLEGWTVAS